MKRPSTLWIILAAAWAVLSALWLGYVRIVMDYNVIAIACGYPDIKGKAYGDCAAKYEHTVFSNFIFVMLRYDGAWIVLPALVLFGIGVLIATRKARRAALG